VLNSSFLFYSEVSGGDEDSTPPLLYAEPNETLFGRQHGTPISQLDEIPELIVIPERNRENLF
jgi:hypothetical protein